MPPEPSPATTELWRSAPVRGPGEPIGKGEVVRYLGSLAAESGPDSGATTYEVVSEQLELFGTLP